MGQANSAKKDEVPMSFPPRLYPYFSAMANPEILDWKELYYPAPSEDENLEYFAKLKKITDLQRSEPAEILSASSETGDDDDSGGGGGALFLSSGHAAADVALLLSSSISGVVNCTGRIDDRISSEYRNKGIELLLVDAEDEEDYPMLEVGTPC